jgi:hypothetical protein
MIEDIKALIEERKYIITLHAKKRMDERGVSSADLITLIMNGDIIEEYPDSEPCPSALILGTVADCHCHAVVALCKNHARIITVYWSDEEKWIDHKTRKSN